MQFVISERCYGGGNDYIEFICNKCKDHIKITKEYFPEVSMFEKAPKYQDLLSDMHKCSDPIRDARIENMIEFLLWTKKDKWFTPLQIRTYLRVKGDIVSQEEVVYYITKVFNKNDMCYKNQKGHFKCSLNGNH